ncbi:MAG: hypothetical protein ABIN67_05700 [Ferruginibacter sp.]
MPKPGYCWPDVAVRGLSGSGTAATHHSNGVNGALLSLAPFGAVATISSAPATTKATAHPFRYKN